MADTIRRITIQGKTEGVKDATRDVKALGSAIDGVAASSEKQNRSQLSVANALEKQRRSLDGAYRAQQDLEKSQRVFDRGLQQGLIGQQEHSRLMGLAKERAEQAADGMTTMERALSRLQNTLTRRFIFAALVNELRDLAVWLVKLPSLLATVGDSARRLGVSGQALQGYEGAAGTKGIDTTQFLSGAQGLASALNESKTAANDLWKLFQLNGGQVKTWEEALLRVADLVRNARSEQDKFNILAQANLPQTREWVKFLEQGSEQIRATARNYESMAADDRLIRQAEKFDSAWKTAWTNFSLYARVALGSSGDAVSSLVEKSEMLLRILRGIPGAGIIAQVLSVTQAATRATSPRESVLGGNLGGLTSLAPVTGAQTKTATTLDPKALETQLNLERQRLGVLGEIATVTDQVRAKEIELTLAGINRVKITKEERAALLDMARVRAEEQDNAIRVANGVATAEQLRATKERELGVLVRANKLSQDEANIALAAYSRTIQETIERQKVYTATLPNLKQLELDAGNARKGIDELATTSLNGLSTSLTDGIMRTRTWGDAFRNFGNVALRAMSDLIVKMTIIQPLARGLQASLGGSGFLGFLGIGGAGSAGGSALGSLFHTGGIAGDPVAGRYVHPAYFENAPRYHTGGLAGDEVPAILQRGEEVLRRDDPRHRKNGGGGVNVTIVNNNDFRGSTADSEARIKTYIDMQAAKTRAEVPAIVQQQFINTPAFLRKS